VITCYVNNSVLGYNLKGLLMEVNQLVC